MASGTLLEILYKSIFRRSQLFRVGCSCAKDVYIAKVVIWTFAIFRLLKNQDIQSHAEVLLWDCKYLERNDL